MLKDEVIQKLKYSFKHITGMWPKTATFKSEEERLKSWQTTQVIKQRIFKPSKRLVLCELGVEDLYKEKYKYEEFLKKFRPRKTSSVKKL